MLNGAKIRRFCNGSPKKPVKPRRETVLTIANEASPNVLRTGARISMHRRYSKGFESVTREMEGGGLRLILREGD